MQQPRLNPKKEITYSIDVDPDTILTPEEEIRYDEAMKEKGCSWEDIIRERIQSGIGV